MAKRIKVSVVLPVYNGERYLRKCLDDILGQSLREIEVICVDDGSTDGTLAILKEYEKSDPRVRAVYQDNAGAAVARNYGMTLAGGKYLSFLDADDFFERDMLRLAFENAEREQADIVIFRGDRYDDTLEKYIQMNYSIKSAQLPGKNPFSFHDIPDRIFTFAVGWAWDKLYLRAFVEQERLRFQNLRTSNDLLFVFSSFVKAKKIYTMEELLVHHRIHVKGSLSVTRQKSWGCFLEASNALREELLRMGIYEETEKGFLDWALHFCFWNLDTIDGEAYEKVYDLIVGECDQKFGFTKHARDSYAQPELYDRLLMMKDNSCAALLLREKRRLEQTVREQDKKLRMTEEELREVRESAIFRAGRLVTAVPRRVKKIIKGDRHA